MWAVQMAFYSGASEIHHNVSYFTDKQRVRANIYGCNTINSILSIWTYIHTSIILLPTSLLSFLSSTLLRTFQNQCIMVTSCTHVALTRQAGSTFVGLITCSVFSTSVAPPISTKNMFRLCPSFNLKAITRQQLYEIWPYMWSIIICPFVHNPLYFSSNSSCSKVHLNIDVIMYGFFGHPFL